MKALQSQRCKNEECFKPSDLVSYPDIYHRHVKNKCQEGPANLIKLTLTVTAEVSPTASKNTANDCTPIFSSSMDGQLQDHQARLQAHLPQPKSLSHDLNLSSGFDCHVKSRLQLP